MRLPEYCPNPICKYHDLNIDYCGKYYITSAYRSKAHGYTQCFRCKICNKSFSEQTFALDYYAKKTIDYEVLLNLLTSCLSIREISRFMMISIRTVLNRIKRLSYQIQLFQQNIFNDFDLSEDIVIGNIRSFCQSKNNINKINIAIGKYSQFIYCLNFNDNYSGCNNEMSIDLNDNKKNVKKYNSIHSLTNYIDKCCSEASNSKIIYDNSVLLQNHPQTENQQKEYRHSFFSMKYIEKEIRKDLAQFVIESTRFARKTVNFIDRIILYQFWHNNSKRFRINQSSRNSLKHFSAAGFNKEKWLYKKKKIFDDRIFKENEHKFTEYQRLIHGFR